MNRKKFLIQSSAAAVGLAFFPGFVSCSAQQRVLFEPLRPSSGNLQRVRGNVFRFVNQGGNVGVFETKEGFVVVDSQFPPLIKPVIDAISQKNKPVLYLANTHHHGDHTSGNISFQNLTDSVVAHKRVPELQRKAAEEKDTLGQQLYANLLFEDEFSFDLGNEKAKAIHLGAGHTFGDAVYHFEKDNVVHMGDQMFVNIVPVYRPKDGSNSFGWINALQKALDRFDNDTLFIFGHADKPENATGTKEHLREMKRFLEASNAFMQKNIDSGVSDEEILKEHRFIPGFANRNTPDRFPGFIAGIRETLTKN